MLASGLPEFIPFICISAIWGQLLTLLFVFPQLLSNQKFGELIHIWRPEITDGCDISCLLPWQEVFSFYTSTVSPVILDRLCLHANPSIATQPSNPGLSPVINIFLFYFFGCPGFRWPQPTATWSRVLVPSQRLRSLSQGHESPES